MTTRDVVRQCLALCCGERGRSEPEAQKPSFGRLSRRDRRGVIGGSVTLVPWAGTLRHAPASHSAYLLYLRVPLSRCLRCEIARQAMGSVGTLQASTLLPDMRGCMSPCHPHQLTID